MSIVMFITIIRRRLWHRSGVWVPFALPLVPTRHLDFRCGPIWVEHSHTMIVPIPKCDRNRDGQFGSRHGLRPPDGLPIDHDLRPLHEVLALNREAEESLAGCAYRFAGNLRYGIT